MAKTQAASNKTSRKRKCSKAGRSEKKSKGRMTPIALYVRDKITAAEYFRLTNQGYKKS